MVKKKDLITRIEALEKENRKLAKKINDHEIRLLGIEDLKLSEKIATFTTKFAFIENQKPQIPLTNQMIDEWINGEQKGDKK